MSRRSFLVALCLILLLVGGLVLTPLLLLCYEPDLYTRAAVPPGEERARLSHECVQQFFDLYSDATNGDRTEPWGVQFTDQQVNSYLDEEFITQGLAVHLLPKGVSRPRFVFDAPDRVHIGFRYDVGGWSTVISIDVRVWLAHDEVNVVCLEIEGFHAGALPIAAQSLLEHISETARERGIDVTWYRHDGHPTAALRFLADQPHSTLLLKNVQVTQGTFTIRGQSLESSAVLNNPMRFLQGIWQARAEGDPFSPRRQ
jgi:hypothetical protein